MKHLLSLLSLLLPTTAWALCTPAAGSSIALPNLTFARDIPLNSQLGSDIASTPGVQFNCDSSDSNSKELGIKMTTGAYVTMINGRSVFSTNVPGIGYAAGFTVSAPASCSRTTVWVDGSNTGDGNIRNRLICSSSGVQTKLSGTFYLAFYKIAPSIGTGTVQLSNNIRAILRLGGTWLPYLTQPGETPLLANTFSATATSCALSGISSSTISLPVISNSALPTVGSLAGNTSFALTINCPATTKLYLTFTDNNNSGQTSDILSLGSGSTAKGVGLQLAYQGSPISFGPDSATAGNSGQLALAQFAGLGNFPFSVSYIRTGTVTPGSVSATATFTLSYQ
ncbi:fimbrial protein [Aquitalea aquatica]|uniref:Fimbrial protein n=1 Tax=Aquitalea aquatica TaxID=3044273 RepID=A0A838Y4X5_9NEIS|nr:fimbrial protein [Aquitalea magnusonii]MBA4708372.1 fimbrial protein [Aquitalea magnusonii]